MSSGDPPNCTCPTWGLTHIRRNSCPVHGESTSFLPPPEIPLVEPFALIEEIAAHEDNSDLRFEEREQIKALLAQNRALRAEVASLKLVAKRRAEHVARLLKADKAAKINKECIEMQHAHRKTYDGALREALVELCFKFDIIGDDAS